MYKMRLDSTRQHYDVVDVRSGRIHFRGVSLRNASEIITRLNIGETVEYLKVPFPSFED